MIVRQKVTMLFHFCSLKLFFDAMTFSGVNRGGGGRPRAALILLAAKGGTICPWPANRAFFFVVIFEKKRVALSKSAPGGTNASYATDDTAIFRLHFNFFILH